MRDHDGVTRDGQRFLFAALAEEATSPPITVVVNPGGWIEEVVWADICSA